MEVPDLFLFQLSETDLDGRVHLLILEQLMLPTKERDVKQDSINRSFLYIYVVTYTENYKVYKDPYCLLFEVSETIVVVLSTEAQILYFGHSKEEYNSFSILCKYYNICTQFGHKVLILRKICVK